MKIFYSPSRDGFFSPEVHDPMPPDAVHRVNARRHAELLAAQEAGAQIAAGADGRPRLVWPDLRPALLARIKREARRRIEAISPPWRQMNDMREQSDAGAARFVAIDLIRAASTAIEAELAQAPCADLQEFAVRHHCAWPEFN